MALERICVLDRSVMAELLEDKKFTNVVKVPDNATCARLLAYGRVNAVFGGWRTTAYGFQSLGFSKDDIVAGIPILESDIYFIASKRTDPRIISRMQDAFASMKADGLLDKMLDGN